VTTTTDTHTTTCPKDAKLKIDQKSAKKRVSYHIKLKFLFSKKTFFAKKNKKV